MADLKILYFLETVFLFNNNFTTNLIEVPISLDDTRQI